MITHLFEYTPAFGRQVDLGDIRDFRFDPMLSYQSSTLPATINLIAGFGDVFDQRDLGSCVSQAACAAFEYDLKKQNLPEFTPSRLFNYYFARPKNMRNVDSGTTIRAGIKALNSYGVCPESEWAYDTTRFAEMPPEQCILDAKKDKAVAYHRLPQNITQMEACLAQEYPFPFGISVYQSFLNHPDGTIPMPMSESGDRPLGEGHALVCVGYDHAARMFIFRNSWGKEKWGGCGGRLPGGYGVIPYEYMISENASDFWVVTSVIAGSSMTIPMTANCD